MALPPDGWVFVEADYKQAELFGIRLPSNEAQKEIEGASSFWLSPTAVQNLVGTYLQEIGGKEKVDHTIIHPHFLTHFAIALVAVQPSELS